MLNHLLCVVGNSKEVIIRLTDEDKSVGFNRIKYEIAKGKLMYDYKDDYGQYIKVPIQGFWIRITTEGYTEGNLTKYNIEDFGPLSTSIEDIKILCDELAKYKIPDKEAMSYIREYITKARNAENLLDNDCWLEGRATVEQSKLEEEL